MSCSQKLRSADIFGHPINFFYKGQPTFQTKVGGCFTVILCVIVTTFLVEVIAQIIFQGSQFNVMTQIKYQYFSQNDNIKADTLFSDYAIMGGLHTHTTLGDGITVDQVARIQFYQLH